MILYLDTSALTKRYLDEPGSQFARDLIESAELRVTTVLTQLEIVAAIEFAKRIRRINSPVCRAHAAAVDKDVRDGTISLLEISQEVILRAIPLARVHRLKSPDAIQLATALAGRRHYGRDFQFLCADRTLLQAARAEGLRCKDVSK